MAEQQTTERGAPEAVAKFYNVVPLVYFITATASLMILSFGLFAFAIWDIVDVLVTGGDPVAELLNSIGLLIIGFAVMETAKFIAEEEVLRKRELRTLSESRASLTKFITIIVIAASLEALVMVFRSTRDDISDSVFPALLLATAAWAVVCLGLYQWLSSRVDDGRRHAGEGR